MPATTIHRLLIPNWQPARLNQYVGRHWAVGHRLKKKDRNQIGVEVCILGIPKATGKRRVSLVITLGPRQRRSPDADGFWKSLLDALVQCNLLIDDSPAWCVLGPVEFRRGEERGTEIVLEDVG